MILNTPSSLLKIHFEDKIKRTNLPGNFRELRNIIIKSFLNTNLPEMFEVYYMDDERDLIHIENDYDYENALMFVRQNCHLSLKVTIKSPGEKLDYKNAIEFLDNSAMNSRITVGSCKPFEIKQEQIVCDAQLNCLNCGRNFYNSLSHSKHSKVCEKVFKNKRIPFDSKKQRWIEENRQHERKEFNLKLIKLQKEQIKSEFKKFVEAFRRWKNCLKMNIPRNKLHNNAEKHPEIQLLLNRECAKCQYCKRSFSDESIRIHSRNCFKIRNKRRPFDSKKQRIVNLEHAVLLRRQEIVQLKKEIIENQTKKEKRSRWKSLSQRWRTILRISRLLYKAKSD